MDGWMDRSIDRSIDRYRYRCERDFQFPLPTGSGQCNNPWLSKMGSDGPTTERWSQYGIPVPTRSAALCFPPKEMVQATKGVPHLKVHGPPTTGSYQEQRSQADIIGSQAVTSRNWLETAWRHEWTNHFADPRRLPFFHSNNFTNMCLHMFSSFRNHPISTHFFSVIGLVGGKNKIGMKVLLWKQEKKKRDWDWYSLRVEINTTRPNYA